MFVEFVATFAGHLRRSCRWHRGGIGIHQCLPLAAKEHVVKTGELLTGERGLRCCAHLPPLLFELFLPPFHHVNLVKSMLDKIVTPAVDVGVVTHVTL